MTRFELNILGCGSATTSLQHLPSCQVLNIRDNLFMIDCGEGAQLEMRRMKLKFSRLNHIFISHLHGDHCFGLPGLLSTLALLGKTGSVTLHIFEEGAEQFKRLMDYFCRDMSYELRFHIIEPRKAVIYEDNGITVTTFPLRHRIPAVGFLFAEKPKLRHINPEAVLRHEVPQHYMNNLRQGKDYVTPGGLVIPNSELTTDADPAISYAYCSDTMLSKRVINAVRGVDWLYHEATYGDECAVQARKRYHSTARDAATVARDAGVKQLIIGHFSNRYQDNSVLLEQAREVFPSTLLAREGLVLDLNAIDKD
ncbi:MAG: ribonuclease Z [Muribaculaceae bacterium]|nr:ribonuclease Z [Muribaculaceae bacterium]